MRKLEVSWFHLPGRTAKSDRISRRRMTVHQMSSAESASAFFQRVQGIAAILFIPLAGHTTLLTVVVKQSAPTTVKSASTSDSSENVFVKWRLQFEGQHSPTEGESFERPPRPSQRLTRCGQSPHRLVRPSDLVSTEVIIRLSSNHNLTLPSRSFILGVL